VEVKLALAQEEALRMDVALALGQPEAEMQALEEGERVPLPTFPVAVGRLEALRVEVRQREALEQALVVLVALGQSEAVPDLLGEALVQVVAEVLGQGVEERHGVGVELVLEEEDEQSVELREGVEVTHPVTLWLTEWGAEILAELHTLALTECVGEPLVQTEILALWVRVAVRVGLRETLAVKHSVTLPQPETEEDWELLTVPHAVGVPLTVRLPEGLDDIDRVGVTVPELDKLPPAMLTV
jgi:hypothetical protein